MKNNQRNNIKRNGLLFSSILLMLFFQVISSHAEQWENTFGGIYSDGGLSVQQTSDGGYILVGETQTSDGGDFDVYLIKTNKSGTEQWSKTFGGTMSESGRSVSQTSDNGYIIVGKTGSNNESDVYLIKTDGIGNLQWEKTYGLNTFEDGWFVTQTEDGGYIIVGATWSLYGRYVYLIKTDPNGIEQWHNTFGGVDSTGYCVKQTSDGGYILVGEKRGSGAGLSDVYLIKTDELGTEQWSKNFGGTLNDGGRTVFQTSDGGYAIAGDTESFGQKNQFYLIKTDSIGNMKWEKTYGGSGADEAYSMYRTSDGGYVIVGSTNSYGAGDFDVYLVKTDGNGNQQWDATFGGIEKDGGLSVYQTNNDGYIIVGNTYSYGSGNRDVYLIYYDENNLPFISVAGFQPPFDNITTIKNTNRCVPLKTELLDANGFSITDADISHPPILVLDSFSSSVAPSDSTVFDGLPPSEATDGIHFVFNGFLWCFNLKIKDYCSDCMPGTYKFRIESGDQSEYLIDSEFAEVTFAVRK